MSGERENLFFLVSIDDFFPFYLCDLTLYYIYGLKCYLA